MKKSNDIVQLIEKYKKKNKKKATDKKNEELLVNKVKKRNDDMEDIKLSVMKLLIFWYN